MKSMVDKPTMLEKELPESIGFAVLRMKGSHFSSKHFATFEILVMLT